MGEKNKTKPFIKTELTVSANDGAISDYTIMGARVNFKHHTKMDIATGYKVNKGNWGNMTEVRTTVPITKNGFGIESRERLEFNDNSNSFATRNALKYSKRIGKVSIYEIAGVNYSYNITNKNSSIGPVSLTGVEYDINKNSSVYLDFLASKSKNITTDKWGDFSPSFCLGYRLNF